MANWVIPCSTASYDVIGAFQTLKKLDWKQSTNVEVGSLVYIYVSAPISAIKFKCKAVEVNKTSVTIDDSEFVINGEAYENSGRYMCLELQDEYPDGLFPKDALLGNGLKTIQGPSKVSEELQLFLSRDFNSKKYTVAQAVWIATALMTCEKFETIPDVKLQDVYFRNSEITRKAQTLTEDTVDNARISWWCCADTKQHTYNYLRGDNSEDESLRRLSCYNEFAEKTMPENLDESDVFLMNGRVFTMEELIYFVKEQYPGIVENADVKLEKEVDGYWPKLSEYDPGIDAKTYEKLLVSACVHEHLDVLYYMYLMGGAATCKQIAIKFGNTYNHYLTNANNIAKNIARETGCPLHCRDNGSLQYWPVLFFGKDADKETKGVFWWKLREPLRKAIERLNERGVFDDMKPVTNYDRNMILYGPPGTGKTYYTVIYAVAIADNKAFDEVELEAKADYQKVLNRYNELKKEERIAFTTFHQSYGYEEFIEGIKPIVDSSREDIGYVVEDGIFKAFCKSAEIPKIDNIDHAAKVWKVTLKQPGESELKTECFKKGVIKFDWKRLEECGTLEACFVDQFVNRLKVGDVVVSYYGGATDIDGVAIVTGDAVYDETEPSFRWKRTVTWIYTGKPVNIKELNGDKYLSGDQIYCLTRIKISELLQLVKPQEYKENDKNYVFIIDEINRGNISKIFGELITLIEESKRKGAAEEMSAILPYSAESFSVPNNVYIIGTMNTADRSIALMDTALRRRFQFVEMMPKSQVLYDIGANVVNANGQTLDVAKMLEIINKRIEYLYDREHTIGHAFFTKLKDEPTVERLGSIFQKSVVPLLQEYFYEDYEKIQLVLGDNEKADELKFVKDSPVEDDIFNGYASDISGLPEKKYEIQESAFTNMQSYKAIHKSL